jgi:murein DD-endopeptidase MepM/ murein hydrolase activator NlpD
MGKIHLKKLKKYKLSAFIIMLITTILMPLSAHAVLDDGNRGCVPRITNPAAGQHTEMHAYGGQRTATHTHQGIDIMMPMCTPVKNQPDCKIILNDTNSSPLWKMGGLGFVTRYKCGPRVEVRYGHLNGYNATSQMVINGESGAARGTGAHIHYEVYVYDNSGNDGFQVDPECVWGNHRTPSVCPSGLGIQPADMCDDTVLDALRNNAKFERNIRDLRATASRNAAAFRDGEIIDPSNVPSGEYGQDLPCDGSAPPSPPKDIHTSHEGSHDSDEPTNEGTEVIPGTEGGDPPDPVPPPPPIPGTPGGDPNLVPATEAEDAPEKFSGCAADTWTAMVNQAVMETRREDILNKRFIVKADSVLEYSCFNEQSKHVVDHAGPLFSETEKWNELSVDLYEDKTAEDWEETIIQLQVQEETNDPFFSEKDYNFWRDYVASNGTINPYKRLEPASLDMAIDSIVTKAALTHLENNFNHGYLADSAPVSGADTSTCNVMNVVWKAAKCKNFDGADVFYTFEDLATKPDPREFPASMPCF